jgi:hypothetical protein
MMNLVRHECGFSKTDTRISHFARLGCIRPSLATEYGRNFPEFPFAAYPPLTQKNKGLDVPS